MQASHGRVLVHCGHEFQQDSQSRGKSGKAAPFRDPYSCPWHMLRGSCRPARATVDKPFHEIERNEPTRDDQPARGSHARRREHDGIAAAGFRAGWARLARFVSPKLREWEARWWRAVRENDQLKARVGSLLRGRVEISLGTATKRAVVDELVFVE